MYENDERALDIPPFAKHTFLCLGLKAALGTFANSSSGVDGGQGAFFALAMIESAIGKLWPRSAL